MGEKMRKFFAVAFLLFCVVQLTHSALLRKDSSSPYKAYGNGTVYNLEKVFKWPVPFNNYYAYWWNPAGDAYPPCGKDVAICQKPDTYWSAGQVTTAVWTSPTYNYRENATWTITYYADQLRLSIVEFVVDPTVDTPQLSMLGEDPYCQYNFRIVGKCIGQPIFTTGGSCVPSEPYQFEE